ncbi:MAG: CvpA family protein [Myxococcota bacterium]|nr:CvpA family protein [Myxococcota bacterium]
MIDGLAASLALTLLWTGWETGSVYQLGQTVTVLMAALVARFLTLPLAGFVVGLQDVQDPDHAVGAAFLGGFVAIYGLLWISVINLTTEMRNFHERGPGDRVLGAGCGALRGGLMGLVLIVGLMTMTFDRQDGTYSSAIQTSRVGPIAARYDFLAKFADALEQDLAERADRPPARDPAWDTPQ